MKDSRQAKTQRLRGDVAELGPLRKGDSSCGVEIGNLLHHMWDMPVDMSELVAHRCCSSRAETYENSNFHQEVPTRLSARQPQKRDFLFLVHWGYDSEIKIKGFDDTLIA